MTRDAQKTNAEERKLRDQLRREAAESRPSFSQAFHRHMIYMVHRLRQERPVVPNRASPGLLGLAGVLAAACLLGVLVIGWWPSSPPQQQDGIAGPSSVESLDPSSPAVQLAHLEHLEHDARLAANMLLQRLPIDVELADEP
jgi:hypothetical protein